MSVSQRDKTHVPKNKKLVNLNVVLCTSTALSFQLFYRFLIFINKNLGWGESYLNPTLENRLSTDRKISLQNQIYLASKYTWYTVLGRYSKKKLTSYLAFKNIQSKVNTVDKNYLNRNKNTYINLHNKSSTCPNNHHFSDQRKAAQI